MTVSPQWVAAMDCVPVGWAAVPCRVDGGRPDIHRGRDLVIADEPQACRAFAVNSVPSAGRIWLYYPMMPRGIACSA